MQWSLPKSHRGRRLRRLLQTFHFRFDEFEQLLEGHALIEHAEEIMRVEPDRLLPPAPVVSMASYTETSCDSRKRVRKASKVLADWVPAGTRLTTSSQSRTPGEGLVSVACHVDV